jgi:23S rRNA (cytosine1962-C5)-methyltransferase
VGFQPENLPKNLAEELSRSAGTVIPGHVDESRRLFHGRGRVFPGLEPVTIDWFEPVAFVVLYDDTAEPWLGALAEELRDIFRDRLAAVVVQRRYLTDAPSELLYGALPEKVYAREAGLRYELRLGEAQNIGFFLDMAQGRELVRGLSNGRRVLNLFSYTCSFSVAALAGGAEHVVNLDMSRRALDIGRVNHQLNGIDQRRASFLPHDLFKSFGKLRRLGPFGVIVVDPPEQQGGSFSAVKDWARVVRRLGELAAPGCDILAALNSPKLAPSFITELFSEELPGATLVSAFGASDDFPESEPERGLKLFHFKMA